MAQRLTEEYLALGKHGGGLDGPLFRPVRNNRAGRWKSILSRAPSIATSFEADIAQVQEWLGHANVSTTRPYDPAQEQA